MLVHLKLSWNIFECSIKKITTYDNHHKSALFYDRKTIGFLSDIIINGKSFFIDGWVRFTGGSTALSNWFVAILYEPFLIGIYIKFNFNHSDRLVFFCHHFVMNKNFRSTRAPKKKVIFLNENIFCNSASTYQSSTNMFQQNMEMYPFRRRSGMFLFEMYVQKLKMPPFFWFHKWTKSKAFLMLFNLESSKSEIISL